MNLVHRSLAIRLTIWFLLLTLVIFAVATVGLDESATADSLLEIEKNSAILVVGIVILSLAGGIAIGNTMGKPLLRTSEEKFYKRLTILHEIDQAILSAQSTETIAKAALTQIQRLIASWRSAIVLFDFVADEAIILAESDEEPSSTSDRRIPLQAFGVSDTLRRGEVFVQHDLTPLNARYEVEFHLIELGVRSYIDAPLRVQGHVIGSLSLDSRQAYVFQTEEIEIVQEVADQLAIAIQQARLYEQIQRHNEELERRVADRTHELAEANGRLTELDRLKTRFVSDVSHELRTPVTSLQLHLDLLERGKPEKHAYYLQVIRQQSNRLRRLIEDVLDLSRLELGRDRIAFGPVNLNTLAGEIVTLHQAQAEAKNLALTFEPDTALPPVHGEVNQLALVVSNLVANALNYTAVGFVHVSTFQIGGRGCLRVADSGLGIDADDLPHIFERFYRGKRPMEQNISGTGLGLGIVKEIVDLHRGHISVESQVDKGSIFQICLPIDKGEG